MGLVYRNNFENKKNLFEQSYRKFFNIRLSRDRPNLKKQPRNPSPKNKPLLPLYLFVPAETFLSYYRMFIFKDSINDLFCIFSLLFCRYFRDYWQKDNFRHSKLVVSPLPPPSAPSFPCIFYF